jgi:hypothetical protein
LIATSFFDIEEDIILGIKTQQHADEYVAKMKHHLTKTLSESTFKRLCWCYTKSLTHCDPIESPSKKYGA